MVAILFLVCYYWYEIPVMWSVCHCVEKVGIKQLLN